MKPSIAKITRTFDVDSAKLNAQLKRLKRTVIHVGIASGKKGDKRSDTPISNHELGFIHEFGSPAANIPARPFLRPGVNSAKEDIAKGFERAIKAALEGDGTEMNIALEITGMKTVSAVKKFLRNPDPAFAPLKDATLRNRNRSRMTESKRKSEQGGQAHPLINTGALRDALDYYVDGGKHGSS